MYKNNEVNLNEIEKKTLQLLTIQLNYLEEENVCPVSLDTFYIVTYIV